MVVGLFIFLYDGMEGPNEIQILIRVWEYKNGIGWLNKLPPLSYPD